VGVGFERCAGLCGARKAVSVSVISRGSKRGDGRGGKREVVGRGVGVMNG